MYFLTLSFLTFLNDKIPNHKKKYLKILVLENTKKVVKKLEHSFPFLLWDKIAPHTESFSGYFIR